MKRLFAIILIVTLLLSGRAFAQDDNRWADVSSADEFYIVHESLSLRRPTERFLVLEKWGVARGRPDGWAIRGLTFPKTNAMTTAVSLRQLLYAGKNTDTVMETLSILEDFDWTSLDGFDRYGNPIDRGPLDEFIACSDGSNLTLVHYAEGVFKEVSRHNCAGRTALDELVEDLTPHLKVIDKRFGRDFIKPLTNIPERRRSGALTDSPPP